jgi:hypothetical protein
MTYGTALSRIRWITYALVIGIGAVGTRGEMLLGILILWATMQILLTLDGQRR